MSFIKKILVGLIIMACHSSLANAEKYSELRADAHAPIGVMRDHIHDAGEFMVSYRYNYMSMEGNRDGDSRISNQQVLNNYMVTPTKMFMKMHMFGAMYGITNRLTLGVMAGFGEKNMNHLRANNTRFNLTTSDILDTKINALYQFYKNDNHRFQFNAGISLPTSNIDERAPNGMVMAYPMQIGSGTYDLMPGISYSGKSNQWSWGSQFNAVIPLGRNDAHYSFGNQYQFTSWGAKKFGQAFSVSLRVEGLSWDNIDGFDNRRPATMIPAPTFDPSILSGDRITSFVGVNAVIPSGILKGQRFGVELGIPVYENLGGPNLETDYRLTFGWQYAF